MNQQALTIGLFGFGVVGEGIYHVLRQTPSLHASIKKICIRHPEKKRNADAALFTTNAAELLDDPAINLVVELIDDAEDAYHIVTTALKRGKAVVSANKKLIARHLPELLRLQEEHGVSFLYEAAVAGSIPIIRNLEEYYDNDLLQSINGIINGSTNYILTKIREDRLDYAAALRKAQQLGFAESDPSLDVEGKDAVNKLAILLAHAYGIIAPPDGLLHQGITRLQEADARYAEEKGYRLKLVAQAYRVKEQKVAAFVLPQFVAAHHLLYNVHNEYNGVVLESRLADRQFLYGKGAGRYPTSSAVVSDISALGYRYKYEYKKLRRQAGYSRTEDFFLRVYVGFGHWNAVNKWDFEEVWESYSTPDRQFITGLIHAGKLRAAAWFNDPAVSVVLLPDALVEKDVLVAKSVQKLSLQLAGAG